MTQPSPGTWEGAAALGRPIGKERRAETSTSLLFLTLDPLFSLRGRQVQVREGDAPSDIGQPALATIDLNRQIALDNGSIYIIQV